MAISDPYNPRTYAEHLAPQGRATDLAVFNVLSPAGFYSLDRTPSMPAWSYALTWDPVIEPRALWEARITDAAQTRDRLWLVLYRGLAGKNGDLRGWMDSTFYPAGSEWGEEEVFYGLYGVARRPLVEAGGAGARWGDFELRQAQMVTDVSPGSVIPVALTWRANAPIGTNAKIFFTLGRRAVWRWTDHMRDNINVVASDELGQDACDQGAIGIVDLVKVVNLMRPGPGEPFSFRPGAQFEQALPGEKMLADDRHQQSPDRHQTPRVCRALTLSRPLASVRPRKTSLTSTRKPPPAGTSAGPAYPATK